MNRLLDTFTQVGAFECEYEWIERTPLYPYPGEHNFLNGPIMNRVDFIFTKSTLPKPTIWSAIHHCSSISYEGPSEIKLDNGKLTFTGNSFTLDAEIQKLKIQIDQEMFFDIIREELSSNSVNETNDD
tara:strand:- start:93 stop:476 length:384 start_codon:yes stop_codon:yes gene_type:complete